MKFTSKNRAGIVGNSTNAAGGTCDGCDVRFWTHHQRCQSPQHVGGRYVVQDVCEDPW